MNELEALPTNQKTRKNSLEQFESQIKEDFYLESNEFFKSQTQKEITTIHQAHHFYKLSEHMVDFNVSVLIEFFLYQLIFLVCFGPLSLIFFYLAKRVDLAKNLGFVPPEILFTVQLIIAVANITTFLAYFFIPLPNIFNIEIFYLLLLMILRCYIISTK